jgi:hypothetical protein
MATTNKLINLKQLDQELGGYGLCGDFNDEKNKIIVAAENSPVTEEQLILAIKNHVAQPSDEEIRILNREQGIAKLKELGFTEEQINALLVS